MVPLLTDDVDLVGLTIPPRRQCAQRGQLARVPVPLAFRHLPAILHNDLHTYTSCFRVPP